MRVTALTLLMLLSGMAHASCVGSGSLKTCYDEKGNSYTVHKVGDATYLNGYNSKTGSSWNQNSQRVGNSTFTNGRASNGNSWNSTATKMGNSTLINGRDSQGKTFSTVCGKYGCY